MKKINSYDNFLNEAQIQSALQLSKFANMIDFTYIREDATKDGLKEIIESAKNNNFYGIVINPEFTDYLAYDLGEDDTNIKTITTLDYPDGKSKDIAKISMTVEAISDGADEINMVMNYQKIKKANLEQDEEIKQNILSSVEKDIRGVSNECHKNAIVLKVIIESGLLTLEEVVIACQIASSAGADYIQTSTGTKQMGSELNKVKEMRRILADYIKICAAGGIRTLQQMNDLYPYVDRFATSVIPK